MGEHSVEVIRTTELSEVRQFPPHLGSVNEGGETSDDRGVIVRRVISRRLETGSLTEGERRDMRSGEDNLEDTPCYAGCFIKCYRLEEGKAIQEMLHPDRNAGLELVPYCDMP